MTSVYHDPDVVLGWAWTSTSQLLAPRNVYDLTPCVQDAIGDYYAKEIPAMIQTYLPIEMANRRPYYDDQTMGYLAATNAVRLIPEFQAECAFA
jgi:hypothetical protein